MHKRIDIQDLDIPIDDYECWNKYPKHRWVYERTRLFDAQDIKWSPWQTENLTDFVDIINLCDKTGMPTRISGRIFTEEMRELQIINEIFIIKGDIKLINQYKDDIKLENLIGDLELRLNAFIVMHFIKFTGVITATTVGHNIIDVRLHPHKDTLSNPDTLKLLKKIYKKNELII